jgi:hypothetical protein
VPHCVNTGKTKFGGKKNKSHKGNSNIDSVGRNIYTNACEATGTVQKFRVLKKGINIENSKKQWLLG